MLTKDVQQASAEQINGDSKSYPTLHKTIKVEGLDIFYREAGPEGAP